MLGKQSCNPIDEHAHLCGHVSMLWVHQVQRRRLGKPVTKQQSQCAAVHRVLHDEGRDLGDAEASLGSGDVSPIVLNTSGDVQAIAADPNSNAMYMGGRFTTVEEAVLAVVKRSGVTEPFSRGKIASGVRKACQGRPVDDDAIALLAQKVEETVRAKGAAEIPSNEVGLAILGPLRELDEVAYLRFASVYRSFDSLGDFEREIESLRAAAAARGAGAGTSDDSDSPAQAGAHTS